MKRNKEDAAVTRQTILDAARKVFERKGFAGTTLDGIAAAAKVTRGAIYHHFTDKAEVYEHLLLESSRKSADLIPTAIAEGGSFLQIIERIFMRQLQLFSEDPTMHAQALFALRGDYNSIDRVRKHIQKRHAESIAMLIQAFAEAQAEGVVRPDLAPRDIARAFYSLQNGLVHLSSLPGETGAVHESAAALARVFVAGIATPALQP